MTRRVFRAVPVQTGTAFAATVQQGAAQALPGGLQIVQPGSVEYSPVLTWLFDTVISAPAHDEAGDYVLDQAGPSDLGGGIYPQVSNGITTTEGSGDAGEISFAARALASLTGAPPDVDPIWSVRWIPQGTGTGTGLAKISSGFNSLLLLFDPTLTPNLAFGTYEVRCDVNGETLGPLTFTVATGAD